MVMDRQQIERNASRSGIVSEASNVQYNLTCRDPEYKIEICDGKLDMENGFLPIAKIVPISGSGPSFVARWDQRAEELDIDMQGSPEDEIGMFKRSEGGYSGHHTRRIPGENKHVFQVNVSIPNRTIFEGSISFSKTHDMRLKDKVGFEDNLNP
jgi:hypothetical protein